MDNDDTKIESAVVKKYGRDMSMQDDLDVFDGKCFVRYADSDENFYIGALGF